MATSVSLGYPAFDDGMNWTSLLSRQLEGGVATWDTNASATAVNPLGGVFAGAGSPLQVTQQASPNMSVLVNAGYVAVPHPTAQHGVYLFGLQAQSTLTVAANSSGSARVDIILARVYDTDNSSSYCDIEIVEGTPGNGQPATPSASFLLAVVAVASGASSITNSNITDKRTFTVAAGGILPSTSAAAPPLAAGQVLLNTSLGLLQRLAPPITYTETWTEPGTYEWTAPFTGTVRAQLWAAGGGGSQATDANNDTSGGGGEYAEEPAYAVAEHTVYQVVVGSGGAGGTDSSGPGNGTNTTFDTAGVVANAGQGGHANSGGGDGAGGTGSTNTIHWPGGAGAVCSDPPDYGGAGGGSSAGPQSAGVDGQSGGYDRGGDGGAAPPGGGDGGNGGRSGGQGADGQGPGGGGGAAGDGFGDVIYGGDGADGQMILTWTIQPTPVTPVFSTDSGEDDLAVINTSTGSAGSSGLTPGAGSAYGWGIGVGSVPGPGPADGDIAPEMQVTFDADGQTDFQFDVKWGLAVPEPAVDVSSPSISKGQCRIILQLDGRTLDQVYLSCSASGGVTKPGDGGCWTYYTSSQRGDTPSAGSHTVTLAVETEGTDYDNYGGAHVGNLASVGTSSHPFGGALPSYFTDALTAENCSLRVAGIQAASI